MDQANWPHFGETLTDLSNDRLLAMANGAPGNPVAWHAFNAGLSEALYPALQLVEVALRNRIDRSLRDGADADWWKPGKLALHDFQRRCIKRVSDKLGSNHAPPREGVVISSLPFGFWTAFFNPFHAQTGIGALLAKRVFPIAPGHERSLPALDRRLTRLRLLRNRVFHHERIIHRADLSDAHGDAVNLLEWMNPAMVRLLAAADRFPRTLQEGQPCFERILGNRG